MTETKQLRAATALAPGTGVVLRGRDGELRALSNVCRHRGTPTLDEGRGQAGSLVCPYHAWAYADDGAFRGAPHPGNVEIDPARHALPHFALEVWRGVVFVNVDGRAELLAERLADVTREIDAFGMKRYDKAFGGFAPETWHANWKLAYENGVESYHLFKVHKDTLEPVSSTRRAFYVLGDARAAGRSPGAVWPRWMSPRRWRPEEEEFGDGVGRNALLEARGNRPGPVGPL